MTTDQLLADLEAVVELPEGHAKAQRLESLAERAKEADDWRLEAWILVRLSDTYSQTGEQHKQPVPFGRVLWLLNQHPEETGTLPWNVHWQLKRMASSLVHNPEVPLAVAYRSFDELERRYRQRGYSLRPVHKLRASLARDLGDTETDNALMELFIAAARDDMADCQACGTSRLGSRRLSLGDDAGGLQHWAPVLDGTFTCQEQTHITLSQAALPLLRTGRTDEARRAFLVGYSLARGKIHLSASVGRHIEFCTLTGNEARGLAIIAGHEAWVTDHETGANDGLDFITGVSLLLRRLISLGHRSLPVRTSATVVSLAARLKLGIGEICRRYDARNGTSAISERAAARLRQVPLVDQLPLGLPTRLRPASSAVAGTGSALGPALSPVDASNDELTARALELAEIRHPDTGEAWDRVIAADAELPAEIAARAARYSAGGSW